MHQTSHGYQIFSVATQVGALVDCQVLAHLLRNWRRYCKLNFEKLQKFVKVGSPYLKLVEEIQKSGLCTIFNFIGLQNMICRIYLRLVLWSMN